MEIRKMAKGDGNKVRRNLKRLLSTLGIKNALDKNVFTGNKVKLTINGKEVFYANSTTITVSSTEPTIIPTYESDSNGTNS